MKENESKITDHDPDAPLTTKQSRVLTVFVCIVIAAVLTTLLLI